MLFLPLQKQLVLALSQLLFNLGFCNSACGYINLFKKVYVILVLVIFAHV